MQADRIRAGRRPRSSRRYTPGRFEFGFDVERAGRHQTATRSAPRNPGKQLNWRAAMARSFGSRSVETSRSQQWMPDALFASTGMPVADVPRFPESMAPRRQDVKYLLVYRAACRFVERFPDLPGNRQLIRVPSREWTCGMRGERHAAWEAGGPRRASARQMPGRHEGAKGITLIEQR
jgi:hypothetical protein